jgi:hypothetical protein
VFIGLPESDMTQDEPRRSRSDDGLSPWCGGCFCGAVRFSLAGAPNRVGVCHCLDCRKRHASPINAFATFDSDRVTITGQLVQRPSKTGTRWACATCGVPICWKDDLAAETEIHLGALDDVSAWNPQYELWTKRRAPWLRALPVPQYEEDRPVGAPIKMR